MKRPPKAQDGPEKTPRGVRRGRSSEARLEALELAVAALALRIPGGDGALFEAVNSLPAGASERFETAMGRAWDNAPAEFRASAFRALDEIGRTWNP